MRMQQSGPSMTARVFDEARPHVAETIAGRDDVDAQITAQLSRLRGQDLTAAIWTPVIADGRSRAVLAVGFSRPKHLLGDHVSVLGILATETAVALERQYLLLRLEAEAVRDGLTGAGNRRARDAGLTQALQQAAESKQPLSTVILDFDRFKAFNDSHGHPAGDALLREAVTAWQQRLRPTDLLCRYGGEDSRFSYPAARPNRPTPSPKPYAR
jgi:GAF domain-containing protein